MLDEPTNKQGIQKILFSKHLIYMYIYIDREVLVPALLAAATEEFLIQQRMAERAIDAAKRSAMEERLDVARLELHERTVRLNEVYLMRYIYRREHGQVRERFLAGDKSLQPVLEGIQRRFDAVTKLGAELTKRYKEADAEFDAAEDAL